MERFPTYISLATLIILFAYIIYNEQRQLTSVKVDPEAQNTEINKPTGQLIHYELPEELYFAGERVPLEKPDVRERLEREIQINTYWHNHSITLIKRANRWLPRIASILEENAIPEDFKYLTVIESDLENSISPAQAVGFWQFLRPTAREFGLEVNRQVDERYHPIKSTEAACRYLNKAYEKFGNWTLVAASYNRGRRGVGDEIEKQRVNLYYDLLLPEETSRYVFRILAAKELLTHPEKYGFHVPQQQLHYPESTREVKITETISDLVEFAHQMEINYKLLKRHNPWLRQDRLTVRANEEYTLLIPED